MSDSKKDAEIIERLRALAGGGKVEILHGIVASVDEDNATCDVKLDDNEDLLLPVSLRSTVKDLKGLVIIPKIDSEITFGMVDGDNDFVLINTSEVDRVILDVPKIDITSTDQINITCDKVTFNDGKNGAMVKIKELEKNFKQITDYLKALDNAIDKGLTGVGASTAASGTLGAQAYKTAMIGQTISIGKMNNDKIKH